MAASSWILNLIVLLVGASALQTNRVPNRHEQSLSASCRPNLCSGPPGMYPDDSNVYFYAEFNVPPLPKQIGGTYYIYYNIYFADHYGYMNQFVPQLMLGSALCGNHDDYTPIFQDLKSWHFGSQYFMGLLNASDPSGDGWSAYAATGDLIDTYEGDILYTSFQRSEDAKRWTLTMGIKGNDSAVSVVQSDQPYMGLLNNASNTWADPGYNKTVVGCCWELYGIREKNNYPPFMNYTITTTDKGPNANYFKPWRMTEIPTCEFAPNYTLTTDDTKTGQQTAHFDILYE